MRVAEGKRSKRSQPNKELQHQFVRPSDRRVRAIVLCPVLRRPSASQKLSAQLRSNEARLAEAEGLAKAIDLDVRMKGVVPVAQPRPATLFGSGKVEELRGLARAEDAELIVVDHPLTPVQQRNLEKAWQAKVLDRTGLILEIFGRRAQTKEGRLQVELAHLTYQKSRLVRSWTHLERQRGGFGFLGGPGETQIETDRRIIQDRIRNIERELSGVKRTRELHRANRRRVPYPIVALVGYTNAGKSTLFNRLTGAQVSAKDQLFETLDPTMRELKLPNGMRTIMSDTVGFISDLPTSLIAAFRATLEEVIEADLILLVRDVAEQESLTQLGDVHSVLRELGIDREDQPERILEVWNKIDLLPAAARHQTLNLAAREGAQAVSATSGEGLDALIAAIERRAGASHREVEVEIDAGDGALISWLHRNAEVLGRRDTEGPHTAYLIRIAADKKQALDRKLGKTA